MNISQLLLTRNDNNNNRNYNNTQPQQQQQLSWVVTMCYNEIFKHYESNQFANIDD